MKWFTSRFSPDPSKLDNFSRTSSTKGQSEDEEVQLLFRKASQALAELKETPSIDFPLLNKATRLVQDVERGIAPLQSPDEKLAWQSQLEELQHELQLATDKALGAAVGHKSSTSQQSTTGVSDGQILGGLPRATDLDLADDLFNGLALTVEPQRHIPSNASTTLQTSAPEAAAPPTVSTSTPPLPTATSGVQLSEEIFTGLSSAPAHPKGETVRNVGNIQATQHEQAQDDRFIAHPALVLPAQEYEVLPLGSNVSAQRKKKVIRSRVGYARGTVAPVKRAVGEPFASQGLCADAQQTTKPTNFAAAWVSSEQGSPQHSGAGVSNLLMAASSQELDAAFGAQQDRFSGSCAASPGSCCGSPSVAAACGGYAGQPHQQQPRFEPGEFVPGVGEVSSGAKGGQAAVGVGLAEQLRRGMNLNLEVPLKDRKPAGSTGSASSTVALRSMAAGHSDSEDSITSPEYRPSAAMSIAASPTNRASAACVGQTVHERPLFSLEERIQESGVLPRKLELLQIKLRQQSEELAESITKQEHREQAAKAEKLRLNTEISTKTAKLEHLEAAEFEAAEREDFELAASLGSDLDATKAQLEALQEQCKGMDREVQQAAAERLKLLQRQAKIWASAAEGRSALEQAQQERIQTCQQQREESSRAAEAARLASQQHLQALRDTLAQRQMLLDGKQASVQQQINQATGVLQEELQQEAHACMAIDAEVEELRAALAAKEEELRSRRAAVANLEQQLASISCEFEGRLSAIERDKEAVAKCKSEIEEEERAAAAAREASSLESQRAQQCLAALEEELQAAVRVGVLLQAEAAQYRARADAEQHVADLQAELHRAQLEAEARVAEAEAVAAELRQQQGGLAARRAALQHELGAAERRVASARLCIPELEAEKKAAAAVRDFKEAARLSAAVKAAAAEVEEAGRQVELLSAQVGEAGEGEALLKSRLAEAESKVEFADKEAALAKLCSIQAAERVLRSQLEGALDRGYGGGVQLLRAELQSLEADAASLMKLHQIQREEEGDIPASLLPAAAAPPPAEAAAQATQAMGSTAEGQAGDDLRGDTAGAGDMGVGGEEGEPHVPEETPAERAAPNERSSPGTSCGDSAAGFGVLHASAADLSSGQISPEASAQLQRGAEGEGGSTGSLQPRQEGSEGDPCHDRAFAPRLKCGEEGDHSVPQAGHGSQPSVVGGMGSSTGQPARAGEGCVEWEGSQSGGTEEGGGSAACTAGRVEETSRINALVVEGEGLGAMRPGLVLEQLGSQPHAAAQPEGLLGHSSDYGSDDGRQDADAPGIVQISTTQASYAPEASAQASEDSGSCAAQGDVETSEAGDVEDLFGGLSLA